MAKTRLSEAQLNTSGSNDVATDSELASAISNHKNELNPHNQYLLSTAVSGTNTGDETTVSIKTKLGFTPVNITGDIMTGSLGFPKKVGTGLKIEGTFGWKDLLGDITPRSSGSLAPLLKNFIGNVRDWAYSANDQGDTRFHIPHDYVPGTDLFIHAHWSHNGTNITGGLRIDFYATYAKGHQQASFTTPVNVPLLVSSLTIGNTPQHFHRVDEVQLSNIGGTGSLLNTSLLEVDGILLINYVVTTIPSITGSAYSNTPYLFNLDLHYQSNGLPTKNKSPSFYA